MKTTDTALLGHVSADALAAAALSDLWTMCTSVLVQGRVLGILVGGALGAGNPKLGGIYLQVSLVVLSVVAVFVFVSWNFTEQVWVKFGSDPKIAADAGYYARILSISIPGQVLFGQISQYFSAQRIMDPEVNSSLFALVLNLFLGLTFVLGIGIPNFHWPSGPVPQVFICLWGVLAAAAVKSDNSNLITLLERTTRTQTLFICDHTSWEISIVILSEPTITTQTLFICESFHSHLHQSCTLSSWLTLPICCIKFNT